MEKTYRTYSVLVSFVLALALLFTGLISPALPSGSQDEDVRTVAYAAPAPTDGTVAPGTETTPPAVTPPETTPPAVTPPAAEKPASDLTLAVIEPVKDKPWKSKGVKPIPKVTLNGKKLKVDRDFSLSYKNNKIPGTATLTIKGISPNYKGRLSVSFNIIVPMPSSFKLKTKTDAVVASWAKASGDVTGYKIVYAENAKLSKSKKTKTIDVKTAPSTTSYAIDRSFYKKSYYVKMRAFVKIKDKTYYSPYTKLLNKKTKALSWFKKVEKRVGKETKWIEVDLSKQIVYVYVGKKTLKTFACSSGKPSTPTKKGVFHIYRKDPLHDMKGDWDPVKQEWGYITEDVPWTSYFVEYYAFHGAPWNPQVLIPVDEPRETRSHGCVNMSVKNAKFIYDWAPRGTLVIVHG